MSLVKTQKSRFFNSNILSIYSRKIEIEARRKLEEETHKAMEKLEIKTKVKLREFILDCY